ncbi:MAG: TSUP family transporter [Gemmatimonadaceae bacterium]
MDPLFLVAVLLVAILSAATAAVAGFGIGSLLTPLIAVRFGMPVAVAVVAVPHLIATALRCWRLRRSIDWSVMRSFGVLSALGGMAGALAYTRFSSRALTLLLGALLLATAIVTLSNLTLRWRASGGAASALGLLSGFFGGAAGNQGGLRSAALLTFSLSPLAFVATSTAVGIIVDAARLPFYLWRSGDAIRDLAGLVAIASAGVVIGTLAGERLLFGLTVARFRTLVAWLIAALGVWLLTQAA